MKLDLTSLQKAIHQLNDALVQYDSDVVKSNPQLLPHMRAAAIQAFEFTYELSWKMIKRFLETTEPNPEALDGMDFSSLIRTANERGLIKSDVTIWRKYREDRGTTSHTYSEGKAELIFEHIPRFLEEAKALFAEITKRQT